MVPRAHRSAIKLRLWYVVRKALYLRTNVASPSASLPVGVADPLSGGVKP